VQDFVKGRPYMYRLCHSIPRLNSGVTIPRRNPTQNTRLGVVHLIKHYGDRTNVFIIIQRHKDPGELSNR